MGNSIETKLEILDSHVSEAWEWIIVILVVFIGAAIFCALYELLQVMINLLIKGFVMIFKKIKKPKYKFIEMDFSKRKKQDNYPVDIYLNNAMRYLLEDPESNTRALSELRYAMLKGHYEIQPDVLLELYNRLGLWQFPEED